jgi:hypothetical protein
VPPAVHAEVAADDFVKVVVALPPPLLPRPDYLFSKAVKNIREDKDDMAGNWYLSTGARGTGFYRDKPRQRVDPHRTAPGQTTVQFHPDLERMGIHQGYAEQAFCSFNIFGAWTIKELSPTRTESSPRRRSIGATVFFVMNLYSCILLV